VISNLLDNAIKFTPAGKSISIRVSREGGEARLVVADEGEGIAPEKLDSVFELFMQADAGADRGRGGMGIGLALVRKLVELHGGSVAAASAGKGRGCAFTVRLPAVEPAAPELQHAGMAQPPDRATVLVVEDNEDTRRSLADALSLVGHRVLQAHDGASAIALAGEARPDVVLIDIGLPDMDGYEVARRLRLLQWQAAPTLVALTGYGQQNDRRRAIEVGFDLHLTKPVPPEQLEHAIEACLQTRGRAAA
jgi:CheY-like chemotaxis protein